ncbi:site-specific integrase [Pseudomonas sp. PDM14]|uniref:site-specific integrase n=1 Tax=Pseudomonas sp. PDM14 TaxID=2769288 RepID=UPI00177C4145|nr:site-specific integrase [Pseudomonas sp. PDM14]MBD9483758.1 site-specific integrase [Pseudomonas sp. PDM14]
MHPTTLQKTQTRTSNFYRTRCGENDPSSAQICAALLACAPDLRPNAFSTLKSQIVSDQLARGHIEAAADIRQLTNPVTAPGSKVARKPKPRTIKKVPKEDAELLFKHLRKHGHDDEAAALVLAYFLAVRPCEMPTIQVEGNEVRIIGGKKSATLHRGADRTLVIGIPKILKAITWAAKRLAQSERTGAAIRDRFRKECRALWPRRKKHPTLKSFRHNFCAAQKAAGVGSETAAYVMGHQSTASQEVYGDPRSGDSSQIHVKPAAGADLSKIRKSKSSPRYGAGRVLERIEIPATRKYWGQTENRVGKGQET